MPWRPLPRIAFGVCIYPFSPESQAELPLQIGDELYIIEQGGKDGSWYRGYLVAPPSVLAGLTSIKGQTLEARVFSGIFPQCCVEIRELLGDDTRIATGLGTTNGAAAGTGAISPTSATSAEFPLTSRSLRDLASGDVQGIPVTPSLPNTKTLKLTNRASNMTNRSDASGGQSSSLPAGGNGMVTTRDPNAPRPPAPVPMLKVGDETQTSAQEPLVDEIASCLREWYTAKLHELLLTRKYGTLEQMSTLVQKLDTSRRQLLHKILTEQELRTLREETVWDLVNGNKMLSGEVIVRSPSQRGRLLTADDSPIEVTRLQSMMSSLTEKPQTTSDEHMPHHLLVEFPNSFGELSSAKTIAVNLCSKSVTGDVQPVSEVYALNISASGSNSQEGNMRTLFVDIGSTDLGEGSGSGSMLYVAFKVIVNESLRTPASHAYSRDSFSSNSPTTAGYPSGSMKGGRRSLMWGKGGPPPKSPNTETVDSKEVPKTPAKENKMVKRTVAAAIMRVDNIIKQDLEIEQELTFWTSSTFPSEDSPDADSQWDQMVKDILPSMTGEYRKYPFPQPVKVFIKPFSDPDADDLIKRTPTLLQNISQTRKIGFIGAPSKPRSDIYLTLNQVILPPHASLAHPKSGTVPLGPQQGLANLQLTLEVRRSNGQRIENCIFPSCNSQGHTAWRTTACERGEPWNLTIRLAVPPEDVPGSHVVMSVADLPQFPFALCWIPLWNEGAFIRDSEHILSLYMYDEYTSSIISGRGAYLALPWAVVNKKTNNSGGSIVGPIGEEQQMAALKVRTYLCSTKYSQDPTLLGLLNWKQQAAGALPGLLRRFCFVPEIEIVKLLPEVFDALFEVLVDSAGSEEYENLVFNDLVFVLGIVYDRRFRLAPLVDQYAEQRFKYAPAASCIVRTFIRLLATPTDSDTSQKLRATFKVAVHLLRFVSVAWQQQEAIDREQHHRNQSTAIAARRRQNFLRDVGTIFDSLENLMKNPNPILVGTKTLVVQHFHSWLPELSAFMNPGDILRTAVSFVDACSMVRGKLILYKLLLIIHLSELDVINQPELRKEFRHQTVRWLAPYWGKEEAVTDQWKEQVRLCCSVVASQLNELGEEACEYIPKLVDSYRAIQAAESVEGLIQKPKKSLSLLFPAAYPFPTRPIPESAHLYHEAEGDVKSSEENKTFFDEAMVEIAAVLAGIISLPTTLHLDMPRDELAEFLFSALQVYISLLDGEAYPRQSWLSVHIFNHRSTMRSLEKLSSVMIDAFLPHPDDAEQFNTELWRTFFEALLKLVGSESLALETFPEQKRRAVWKIAGDVREQGADLLRRTWEAIGWETSPEDRKRFELEKLGGYQVQYVPGLVGPIVELCLTVHDSLRGVAIKILQTMIISEWTLSGDLGLIQAEIIECLDSLFKSKANRLGEGVTQKQFVGELLASFEPLSKGKKSADTEAGAEESTKAVDDEEDEEDDGLLDAVKSLIATVDVLLDLLIAVHATDDSITPPQIRLMETLHLMEFLRDMQKVDIFIGYVHQLAAVQAAAGNFTEAGLALRLHADLYAWDPSMMVEPLRDPTFPSQSAFERKELLFFRMIRFYEDGHSWDNALASYMELADQYEHNVFDFAKLARAQRAMATIYEAIGRGSALPLAVTSSDGADASNVVAQTARGTTDVFAHPKYFRVVFRGFGFPVSLRDKQFIYQGGAGERLAAFVDRMQQQFAAATVTAGSSGVSSEEQRAGDVERQFVHIYPVSPQKDTNHPIYRRAKVAQSVRDYYLLSRPMSFTSTNRRQKSATGQEATVEKTVYTTAEAFPTVLKKSEVVEVSSMMLSPVQAAIERTTRKTGDLISVERKLVRGGEDTSTMAALSEILMLSVDLDSPGSVAHYRELLKSNEEEKSKKGKGKAVDSGREETESEEEEDSEDDDEEDEDEEQLDPSQLALKIALIDHALAIKRCLTHYARPAYQATGADLQQRFEETFAPEIDSFTDPTLFGTQMQGGVGLDAMDSNIAATNGPWSPMSMSFAEMTSPRTMNMSPNLAADPSSPLGIVGSPNPVTSGSAAAGQGGNGVGPAGIFHGRSGSRTEKHRLSLTFLRRTPSVSHGQGNVLANGATSPLSSVGSTSPVVGSGKRGHSVNQSIDAQIANPTSPLDAVISSYPIQSPGRGFSSDRPRTHMRGISSGEDSLADSLGQTQQGRTRQSSESEMRGSVKSRVGSVKKRLSQGLLGNISAGGRRHGGGLGSMVVEE